MSDENINMVICLLNYEHNAAYEVAINEAADVDKYYPDGYRVAYIKSNFIERYHADFEHLSSANKKIAKELARKTKKGRKPKVPCPKNIRLNNGTNNEFSSSITFGLIDPNDTNIVYNVKVFRKKSANISGLKTVNMEYIRHVVTILMDYINEVDPNLEIRLVGGIQLLLCNSNFHFTLPESDDPRQPFAFNLYRLARVHKKYYGNEFWGCSKIVIDTNQYPYYKFYIQYGDKEPVVKFYPNGKLIVCGGKDNEINNIIINKFKEMVQENFDYVCHKSIPTRKKMERRSVLPLHHATITRG
jgi:hypothetical protein